MSDVHTDEQYWQALGEFIEAFAVAENSLFLYMARLGEMPDPIARVVSASWKTGTLIKFVQDLWRIKPLKAESAELAAVTAKLSSILAVRNTVIHYRSHVNEQGDRIAGNQERAMPWQTPKAERVSPTLLKNMTRDVLKIAAHFISVLLAPERPFADRRSEVALLEAAWRHKPNESALE